MKKARKRKRYLYRSAKTGRTVTAAYARRHKATTVRETINAR